MFANFQKAIANRVIHKSSRGIILKGQFVRLNPLEFANYEDNLVNTLMANYRHQRLDETLEYCNQALVQVERERKDGQEFVFAKLLQKYRDDLPKHFKDQTISIISYNQVNPKSLPIEPATNLLYLIAKYDQRNPEAEAALIERLKEKDLNDATVSNIGDLLFYFQKTPEAAENHKEFVQAVTQRAQSFIDSNYSTVQTNGSTVEMYEPTERGSYSTLEKGVVDFLEAKGDSDFTICNKFKYIIPLKNTFYSLFSKKLAKNAWLYETSLFNELERVRAYLENKAQK